MKIIIFLVHLASLGIDYTFPHKLKHLYVIDSASLSVDNISPFKLKYVTQNLSIKHCIFFINAIYQELCI